MIFKCTVCGSTETLSKSSGSSFYDIAYDDILQWSDFNSIDDVPDVEAKWERSDITPCEGTDRIVRANFPFNFEIGDTFHVLFMPALSFFNSWEEYPEEISQSAVVHCKFDEIISYNDKYAWIIIHIIKVTPLDKLHETYPQAIMEKFEPENKKRATLFEYGSWSIYYDSCEDWGNWYLFFTDSNMEKHMILACRWDHHISEIKCCNTVFGTPKSSETQRKTKSYTWELNTIANGHLSCENYYEEDTAGVKLLIEKKFGVGVLQKNHVHVCWDIWSGLFIMSECSDGDILVKKIYEYLCKLEDNTNQQ